MTQCPHTQQFPPYLQCDSEAGHKAKSHINFTYDIPTFWYAPTIGELIVKRDARWSGYSWDSTTRVNQGGMYPWSYEPAPLPDNGENIWCSDISEVDKNEKPDLYEFPLTVWGDYVGSSVERSNYRSLIRDFPLVFIPCGYGYNGNSLFIRADYAGIDAQDLFTIGEELIHSYPAYDEEDVSFLEMELADEAWSAYMYADLSRDLRNANVDIDRIPEDELRDHFYEETMNGDESPYCESADSVVFPAYESTLEALVKRYRRAQCRALLHSRSRRLRSFRKVTHV